jgi:hypothetical protein
MRYAGLALVLVAATACGNVEVETHRAVNNTGETIYIFSVWPSGEYALGDVKPGFQRPLNLGSTGGCWAGTLIARTLAGREVARRSDPFCPDQSWLIADPAAQPSSVSLT